MRILLVGALSWNPERIRSLHERGHRLWSVWSRSMGWDQGPYPSLAGMVEPIAFEEVAAAIRDLSVDCVYSLFQVYHQRLWGSPAAGVEHDIWTLLRSLLAERKRGVFDAPIVKHWGFDVQHLDLDVAMALDGQVFCNREKLNYWTAPISGGGCGIDIVADCDVVEFLDSDRPKLEFMNNDFSEPLSQRSGEIHTVCLGRPFGIDYLAAARRGIHVHLYGNAFDDVHKTIAKDLSLADAKKNAALLRHFLHIHPSLQPVGAAWNDVQRAKATWVREFSHYDAGWSYVGSPLPWERLDDVAAIPNRVSTYLLAGLPVISDVRPGYYRYDELTRLGVNIDLVGYDDLGANLEREIRGRERSRNARDARARYSFDATIDPLIATLERVRTNYFAKPHGERSRFGISGRTVFHLNTSPAPSAVLRGLARRLVPTVHTSDTTAPGRLIALLGVVREQWRRWLVPRKVRILAQQLGLELEVTARNATDEASKPGTNPQSAKRESI